MPSIILKKLDMEENKELFQDLESFAFVDGFQAEYLLLGKKPILVISCLLSNTDTHITSEEHLHCREGNQFFLFFVCVLKDTLLLSTLFAKFGLSS